MTSKEMESLLDPSNVFCIKLISGETVMAKTYGTNDTMKEEGGLEVVNCMKIKTTVVHGPNGEIQEILMLAPWIETAAVLAEHFLPNDTIISVVPALPHYSVMYANRLMVQVIKETAAERALTESEMEESVDDDHDPNPTIPITTKEPTPHMVNPKVLMITPPEPRTPELLDKYKMNEAEMRGDIEELPDEEAEEPKPWKVGNITIH